MRQKQKQGKNEKILSEMSKYGSLGKCSICNKPILTSTLVAFGNFPNRTWKKYGLNGTHLGFGIALFYPDGKSIDYAKKSLRFQPFVCKTCFGKYFEQSRDNPKRDYGTPLTEKAWKIATIPYLKDT